MPPLPAIPYSDAPSKLETLLANFLTSYKELEGYRSGKPVVLDGKTLSIAAVTATSRYSASVQLDSSPAIKGRVQRGSDIIHKKVQSHVLRRKNPVFMVFPPVSVAAQIRGQTGRWYSGMRFSNFYMLAYSPLRPKSSMPFPFLTPLHSSSMPESWVRGAILIRMNSLLRGHSGVRWELLQKMNELLSANITPLVPLRGSISASGDLIPLSYVAGTLVGNPRIRVFDGPAAFGARKIVSSTEALKAHQIEPLPLVSKEHLGLLNGTAFSASVACLVLNDAVHLALLSQVCTAMGTEALAGSRGSFDPFIHDTCRPHPGQIESAKIVWDLLEGSKFAITSEQETTIEQDSGVLRQDRYPLRTAPQFIGPQIEDLLASLETVTRECNSSIDIATASYVSELGYRAAPVSTHIQSAEMHNQAVNSLALISGRATIDSLDILSQLIASYLYILCQALDLRALQNELIDGLNNIATEELSLLFGPHLTQSELRETTSQVCAALQDTLNDTSTMDAAERMVKVAASSSTVLLDIFTGPSTSCSNPGAALALIPVFRSKVAARAESLLDELRRAYLFGGRGASPASPHLSKTRPVYEFIRVTLGIKMHGSENYNSFVNGMGVDEDIVGGEVSLIHEAIRDGKMQPIIVGLFA
ncbi:Phenylalanine ammonia-lyase [Mycena venus]|uniref:Phenylalanine ammonia-lyase n=1 Tax=Mycena venus TaxID=2733690 RepID=A0A8H6YP22_9AGAR|nr:Phenylalanine ammonia-lyase [Mycena venus]